MERWASSQMTRSKWPTVNSYPSPSSTKSMQFIMAWWVEKTQWAVFYSVGTKRGQTPDRS